MKYSLFSCVLMATAFVSNAATFITSETIDATQGHLGTSTDSNGVITATYESSTSEYFTFDNVGGTRELEFINLNYGTTFNEYHVGSIGGIEFLQERFSITADVYMYDTSNNLLFSATNIEYQFNNFNNAADPTFNSSMDDITLTRSVYGDNFTNTAVLDALENDGVRFYIQERATWIATDLNGDSIATSLEAGPSFGTNFNDYNFNIQFNANAVVVPEPSSTVLIGLAGLSLIMRRRK